MRRSRAVPRTGSGRAVVMTVRAVNLSELGDRPQKFSHFSGISRCDSPLFRIFVFELDRKLSGVTINPYKACLPWFLAWLGHGSPQLAQLVQDIKILRPRGDGAAVLLIGKTGSVRNALVNARDNDQLIPWTG